MDQLIQTSLFDPVMPYVTEIGQKRPHEWFVEITFYPQEIQLDIEEMKKYFSEVTINTPRPVVIYYLGNAVGRGAIQPTTVKGTLISEQLGKYIYSKMNLFQNWEARSKMQKAFEKEEEKFNTPNNEPRRKKLNDKPNLLGDR